MPTTKSEELNNSIADLKSLMLACNTKIDNLAKTTDNLKQQVIQVEHDITDRINKLDVGLRQEISVLRSADEKIQNQLDEFKETISTELSTIQNNAVEDRKALDKTNNSLGNCIQIMQAQAKRIVSLERECFRGMQHSRGFNIEIDGIPAVIGDEPYDLECAVVELLRSINVIIEDYEVDTVHRLPSKQIPKTTIVRFVSRKTVRACLKNCYKLKDIEDLNIDINGLDADSNIYIRPSQCSYVKNLAFNCRQLKRDKLIKKVHTGKDGRVTVENNDGSFLKVSHMEDLSKNFPTFGKFNFDYVERKRDGESEPQ